MTKRIIVEKPKDDTLIPNKAKTKEYPLDVLKELYIRSDFTLERMSQELQLPISRLERIAKTGLENWHKLKKEYQERRLDTLSENFDENLIDKQSIIQRIEQITLMEMAHRLAEIEAHYKKYGDFFVRNVEEEIVRDGKGQALRLNLPNSPKDLLCLRGLEDIKLSNTALIQTRLSSIKQRAQEAQKQDMKILDIGKLLEGEDD